MATTVLAGAIGAFAVSPPQAVAAATTTRWSISTAGVEGDTYSRKPDISADGSTVAFLSNASNLGGDPDGNGLADVYVREAAGTTSRVTVAADGFSDSNGFAEDPAISADGNVVVFWSDASNLVAGDAGGKRDIFLRDLTTATTEIISVSSAEVQGNTDSEWADVIGDGRYVVFTSGEAMSPRHESTRVVRPRP